MSFAMDLDNAIAPNVRPTSPRVRGHSNVSYGQKSFHKKGYILKCFHINFEALPTFCPMDAINVLHDYAFIYDVLFSLCSANSDLLDKYEKAESE